MSKPPPNTSRKPPPAPPRAPKVSPLGGSPVRAGVVAVPAARLDLSAMTHLNALAARLSTLDYFQILNVANTATPPEIKAAFHRWSREFHPDRFYQVADKELKHRVNEVYKRITEAYYVLRDDVKRKTYLSDISGPERARKLRFTEAAELETKAGSARSKRSRSELIPRGGNSSRPALRVSLRRNWHRPSENS